MLIHPAGRMAVVRDQVALALAILWPCYHRRSASRLLPSVRGQRRLFSAMLQISTICLPAFGCGKPLTTMYASPIVSTYTTAAAATTTTTTTTTYTNRRCSTGRTARPNVSPPGCATSRLRPPTPVH